MLAVPIVEGFAIPHAIIRTDLGGRDVTEHLQLLLRKSGYTFHTSAEKELVRNIKESSCYISVKEELRTERSPYKLPDGSVIEVNVLLFFL